MKLRDESDGSVEDSGPKGEVGFRDLGRSRTEVRRGPDLENRPEDSMLTKLAVEGFMKYPGSFAR